MWCKKIYYKDESSRFNLGSFKALGGAYAIYNLISKLKKRCIDSSKIVVTTATDGNHGRSVAWGAKIAGCKCKIYIHAHVSKFREKAMKDLGADVIRISGNYDESLNQCKKDAKKNSWYIVSDTSWSGYKDIPIQVMAGYSVIAKEISMQMQMKNQHIFFYLLVLVDLQLPSLHFSGKKCRKNYVKLFLLKVNFHHALWKVF